MRREDPANWMWADAVQMLSEAERLQRQLFRPAEQRVGRPCWEPPVDVLETDREVLILAALPGVDPDAVEAVIEDGVLILSGTRVLPPQLETAVIHRLELPQGCFSRRIPLPAGRYDGVRRIVANGCLLVSLRKMR
ncbi:MAG TPA: Hsp20/alpha crystallin family protein [Phenylobacterium sp.]|uniref:Hsp20/alpha crystallin family protein n=1 Tax=Phenylobacterium sp. TaxID=1871053 RepID=UPI002B47C84A|nr:Hsp20/alpha crystallin family protein [Phenylobacterium sp.]HKR87725.1 Hsp20/alpha crystallin family protein [Phenylobacterium sp.]